MPITKRDIVKYPFLPQAADYIKQLNLTIDELTVDLQEILEHAEKRVTSSFNSLQENYDTWKVKEDIIIASFPVAVMIVAAINDKYLKKRYALYEAKRMYEYLRREKLEKILNVAEHFSWDAEAVPQTKSLGYQVSLHFINYLQNAAHIQQAEWKLVNRRVEQGRVYLTEKEACRLLQEEARKHIEEKLTEKITSLPPAIKTAVDQLKNMFISRRGTMELEELPTTVDIEAFPPCIDALYKSAFTGHHLSHIGRFTLTTFLVNIGMPTEKILDLFRTFSDFNERLARYQVEHIAGERGSRTQYRPPKCSTLRTHGICINPEKACERAWYPLACYKRKLRTRESTHKDKT
jgi:DNA primase large subunit